MTAARADLMLGFTVPIWVAIGLYWGYIGIMENEMEATLLKWGIYWGYIGIMENEMEATILK